MALGTILLLGGARSGKSELGEQLAARAAERVSPATAVTYVATAAEIAGDEDWEARVAAHRSRRPAHWQTVETGGRTDLDVVLGGLSGTVLVDSLGTWVAAAPGMAVDTSALVSVLRSRASRGEVTIVVSEEVGLGVHPTSESGMRFRDALGSVNSAVASAADRALLVVAGRVVDLARPDTFGSWIDA
jgi:adenosylcobinamide kinase/adenosylcobinamide-phosphate guanylyltransferase